MKERWRLFVARMPSPGFALYWLGLLAFDLFFVVYDLLAKSYVGVFLMSSLAVWSAWRLGQCTGFVKAKLTMAGLVVEENGPVYAGKVLTEAFYDKISQDPDMSVNPEPDFVQDFGWTRERQPKVCPRCQRPLESFSWEISNHRWEELVCFGGRPTTSIHRFISKHSAPSGHHYAHIMGAFKPQPRVRRRIKLPVLRREPRLAPVPA